MVRTCHKRAIHNVSAKERSVSPRNVAEIKQPSGAARDPALTHGHQVGERRWASRTARARLSVAA